LLLAVHPVRMSDDSERGSMGNVNCSFFGVHVELNGSSVAAVDPGTEGERLILSRVDASLEVSGWSRIDVD
jgi:hypothetical protein